MTAPVQSVPSLRSTMQVNSVPDIARQLEGVVEASVTRAKGTLLSLRVGSESLFVFHEGNRIENVVGAFARAYFRGDVDPLQSGVRRAYRTDITFLPRRTGEGFANLGDWNQEYCLYGRLEAPVHSHTTVVDDYER